MSTKPQVRIVEDSVLARIAAFNLRANRMAITVGKKIYLHNATKYDLTNNERWLRHELKHVEQYQKMGFFKFIFLYLWYSLRYGYYSNPLEVEARIAEADEYIISRNDILV